MAGKRIYEEGNMAARKSLNPYSNVCYVDKSPEIIWDSSNGNTDISQCIGLLGRLVEITVPMDVATAKKAVRIVMLYPHCVKCEYEAGRADGKKYTLTTCLSTADLIEKGLLTFKHGYPEVIENDQAI